MPRLILHEHPGQSGRCLGSMVRYAQRIPVRFKSLEAVADFLRSQPYEEDPGLEESVVAVPEYMLSGCSPWQRERIWPQAFNCWEAVSHWLAHALALLTGNEVVEIWDRTLPTGARHVWPVLERADGIWLVQVEGASRPFRGVWPKAANVGWEDVFGFLHLAGKETLGLFLGNDRAAPIVQMSERAWGSHIADWSKGPTVLGTSIGDSVRADLKPKPESKPDKVETKKGSPSLASKADKGVPQDKKKESVPETPRTDRKETDKRESDKLAASVPEKREAAITDGKSDVWPASTEPPTSGPGMNWNEV